ANTLSAVIDVTLLADTLVEGDETVIVTLTGVTAGDPQISVGGSDTATVTISDNDTATISIGATTSAVEPTTTGKFTVTQTNPSSTDTVLSYTVLASSTADAGVDYVTLSGTVTI